MSAAVEATAAGLALHAVTELETRIAAIHDVIPTLADDDLPAVYAAAEELGKRAWLVQAHCLWEARRRKGRYHDGAVRDLARGFGVTKQWANKLCGAWEAVSETRVSDTDLPLSKSFYVEAGMSDNPAAAVAYAEDRKAADPTYSRRDLALDIRAGRATRTAALSEAERAATAATDTAADTAADDARYLAFDGVRRRLLAACDGQRALRRVPLAEVAALASAEAATWAAVVRLARWVLAVEEARR